MHGICCIDRLSGSGDVHNLTLRRIELHIPLPFPFLQYIKVVLELLIIILSFNGQEHRSIICKETNLGLQAVW